MTLAISFTLYVILSERHLNVIFFSCCLSLNVATVKRVSNASLQLSRNNYFMPDYLFHTMALADADVLIIALDDY